MDIPLVTAMSCLGDRGAHVPVCFRNSGLIPSPRDPLGDESGFVPGGLWRKQMGLLTQTAPALDTLPPGLSPSAKQSMLKAGWTIATSVQHGQVLRAKLQHNAFWEQPQKLKTLRTTHGSLSHNALHCTHLPLLIM